MTITETVDILPRFSMELNEELNSILNYWISQMVDEKKGGFLGKIDHNNIAEPDAVKGIVLNSRILWTFSAAYRRDNKPEYLTMASRAYTYIVNHFIDRKYGGVYWSVDSKGVMLDGKKQIYGLAFCLYGLSEYYKITKDEVALHLAENLFKQIESHSFDKKNGGYLEAFTQGWKLIGDMRLSEKDSNEKKTMNTHLHIIEAYANLYSIWPDKNLKESIKHLLDLFEQHFIDPQTSHLRLFMDEEWNSRSSLISYGHDIEAAWLLLECAEIASGENHVRRFKEWSIRLANAAAEGLDADGGIWYEYEPSGDELVKEKHSWPQAEAMIGFLNAFQLTGDEKYLHHSLNSWEFVKRYLKDKERGEWFWGINADYSLMQKEKAGFWKCPYHNARACMELIHRINLYRP